MNLRTPGKRTEQAKNRVLFLSSSRVFFPVDSFFFNLVQKYELAGFVFFLILCYYKYRECHVCC